jgi:1-acyl-sn-glycerol-3-phosphate acyltransferase
VTERYPFKRWMPAPLYWLYRGVRTLSVVFCFAVFWVTLVIAAWTLLPLVMLWPGARAAKRRRAHAILRFGLKAFHVLMRALWLYRSTSSVRVARPPGVARTGPAVLVANHPTLCDVTSIASMFPDVVALAGAAYSGHPALRYPVQASGFVPAGPHLLRDAEERLQQGFDMLIFPEGTRSPLDGPLHPFHRGAFEIALRAKVPIVLIELRCEPRALSKRLPMWKHPDRMAVLSVEPFDVIDPVALGLDSKALCRAIEQRYRDRMRYPDAA